MNTFLYITYDGLLDPLGQTQILPYLRGLAHQHGHRFVIVSYEKAEKWHDVERRTQLKHDLLQSGITWLPLRYHKRPTVPATLYDVLCGIWHSLIIVKRYNIHALHIRSYVPMLIGLSMKFMFSLPLVFDMRGLWGDERADVGACSRDSLQYRMIKAVERASLRNADQIVTLTHRSVPELLAMPVMHQHSRPINVIPCCVDTQRWQRDEQARADIRTEHGWNDKTVVVYSGSLGGWYRTNDLAQLFATWHHACANTHFLVLSNQDPSLLVEALHQHGIASTSYTIKQLKSSEMASWLSAGDVGISLITPFYSKLASSPTKYAEYLTCGLPIVANDGIGDTALLFDQGVAVRVADFTPEAYQHAWNDFRQLQTTQPKLSVACRMVAIEQYDLHNAITIYHTIYNGFLSHETS